MSKDYILNIQRLMKVPKNPDDSWRNEAWSILLQQKSLYLGSIQNYRGSSRYYLVEATIGAVGEKAAAAAAASGIIRVIGTVGAAAATLVA